MRIAVIRNAGSPAVQYYRSVGVFPWLEKETGGQVSFSYYEAPAVTWADLYPYDVIFVDRPVEPRAFQLIQEAQGMGVRKKVWVDLDDNIFEIPSGNRARRYFASPQSQEMAKQILRTASLITVTTEPLRKIYSEFSDNITIIPNAWNDYDWPLMPVKPVSTVTKIAWRGSDIHGGDLHSIRGVWAELQKDPAFLLHFFGFHESWSIWLDIDQDRQAAPEMNLFQFFNNFYSCGADFLLFPLIDNAFNRAKSNIAWQEATIAGMATIAPASMEEFNQPGVIRYRDARHLRELMDKIKRGRISKEEQVEMSREALQGAWRLSSVNKSRLEAIAGLMGAKVREEPEGVELKAVK